MPFKLELFPPEIIFIDKQMKDIGVDNIGLSIMREKGSSLCFCIHDVAFPLANILKQEALAIGADAAVHRNCVSGGIEKTDVLLLGNVKDMQNLSIKLKKQSFSSLKTLGDKMKKHINGCLKDEFIIKGPHLKMHLGERACLMGILNVTPDSFYDGGNYTDVEEAVSHALEMVDDGADIIDVGGESTRPGAKATDEKEEIERVIPVIKGIRKKSNIPISIDTCKSAVAEKAVQVGANMINDVALKLDKKMINIVKKYNVPIIIMHMKGEPRTMNVNPVYNHLIPDILEQMEEYIEILEKNGVDEEKIIIDPGIGFGKKTEDNLVILHRLNAFKVFGKPILVGASRKSFIGKILNNDVEERLRGTLAAITVSRMNGAHILRVHDVKQAKEALKITDAIMREGT